jgi:predicted DCC family thiol-disulfide oxidoreductase YuxK
MVPQRVVFFDGVCGLCNQFVDYLISSDKNQVLTFAALQGKTAEKTLPIEFQLLETVVYLRDGKVWTRSTAALKILIDLGGWHRVNGIFFIFPRPLRNWVYGYISKNRYKWFGKRESCRIPLPFEKKLFLP